MNEQRTLFQILSKSSEYNFRYPEVAFGLTLISGCKNHFNPPGFDQCEPVLVEQGNDVSGFLEEIAKNGEVVYSAE